MTASSPQPSPPRRRRGSPPAWLRGKTRAYRPGNSLLLGGGEGIQCPRYEAQCTHGGPGNLSRILRHPQDAVLVGLALIHGTLLLLCPSIPLIALGLWWNANTISHNFIHLPFFKAPAANARFSLCLSLLLGFPQSLWAARHRAHHRDQPFRWKPIRPIWLLEGGAVLALWIALLALQPGFFLTVYLPGWLIGLVLCQLQGCFEHFRGVISHHGRIYNWLFFNDGYHVEHHAQPYRHWTQLPHQPHPDLSQVSRWPAVLRWLEYAGLDGLEELAFRSKAIRRFVLRAHEQALARALARMPPPRRVIIVGGGLFPRTALLLRRLTPQALLVLVDLRRDRLERAKQWLAQWEPRCNETNPPSVEFVCGYCTPENLSDLAGDADLVVVPLALLGGRTAFYRTPPAPNVLVHDWLWRPHGNSIVVSCALLKRLNLLGPSCPGSELAERRSLLSPTLSSSEEEREFDGAVTGRNPSTNSP